MTCLAALRGRTGHETGSIGCAPTRDAASETKPIFAEGRTKGGRHVISGLLVDSVKSVAILDRAGSRIAPALRDNVFSVELDRQPVEIRWTTRDGRTRSKDLAPSARPTSTASPGRGQS
jgi:hypothetical protein